MKCATFGDETSFLTGRWFGWHSSFWWNYHMHCKEIRVSHFNFNIPFSLSRAHKVVPQNIKHWFPFGTYLHTCQILDVPANHLNATWKVQVGQGAKFQDCIHTIHPNLAIWSRFAVHKFYYWQYHTTCLFSQIHSHSTSVHVQQFLKSASTHPLQSWGLSWSPANQCVESHPHLLHVGSRALSNCQHTPGKQWCEHMNDHI